MKRYLFSFLCLVTSFSVLALPIPVVENGILMGLDNIIGYDGEEYKVRFATGEFEDAFGMSKEEFLLDETRQNLSLGGAVHQQIYDFLSSAEGNYFEQNSEKIFGCLEFECTIFTPWVASPEAGYYLEELSAVMYRRYYPDYGYYYDAEFPDNRWTWNLKSNGEVWAVWNLVQHNLDEQVPEPSSLSLLAACLLMFFTKRRYQKTKKVS